MAIIRWSPFSEVETLRRQLDKMFDDLAGSTPTENTIWKPAVELQDNGDNLTLKAEIPGVEAKDLDISVLRDAVVIRGEHRYENKTENKGFFRSEFRYGKFERVVGLPVAVQNDKVEANFNNGILTLTLPKVEEAKNRVFKVNLAGNEDTTNTETNTTETK
ncbi:Hsp20/alpha crystallin family protein [Aerosakkonemataceae cyanobacterium BLCC-F50]|uniref:Hsp20/alpha crystallin family protein n=1 Tax=Floridaenema flaviceps BLCC-F50 TaxID=3153642 RepID=A0ABV4XJ00_9CYAN